MQIFHKGSDNMQIELHQIAREIYESGQRLNKGVGELFKLSKEMAESERDYRKALQLEIERLRLEKVQATLIPDIARGITSDLKFKRDLAEARYKSGINSINAIQQQMSGLQTIFRHYEDI